ncbi:hypothetical protein [Parasphingorhabdus pacifica]
MITDLELEKVAAAIERALLRSDDSAGWPQVERLRLHSDLLDRLAAAQRNWTGSLSRQAELVRDSAERLADDLNQVASAIASSTEPDVSGAVPEQSTGDSFRPRWVTRAGTLPRPGEVVPSGTAW